MDMNGQTAASEPTGYGASALPSYQPEEKQSLPADPPPVYYQNQYNQAQGQYPVYPVQAPQVQTVYVRQPALTDPPNDYLVQAILVTICCFWPVGIVAILKSMEVQRAVAMGDRNLAELNSKSARKFTCIGFWIGVVLITLWFLLVTAYVLVMVLVVTKSVDDDYDFSSWNTKTSYFGDYF